VGAGGHAWGILQACEPDGLLLGFDIDTYALQLAQKNLESFSNRATLVHSSFTNLSKQLNAMGWQMVDGILLDLGISSMQLDNPERGFSFRKDALLDMRFDLRNPVRAIDLVNNLPEQELADLLYTFGEERRSRQVARAIVRARPLKTTHQLASVVAKTTSSGRTRLHPATRTFQALRIEVGSEMEELRSVLEQIPGLLKIEGRLAVVTFHSLEDRAVKSALRPFGRHAGRTDWRLVQIGRTETASQSEIRENPRSRSAKLRVFEKQLVK